MALPSPEQLAKAGTEEAHQTALFAWAAQSLDEWPELDDMYHIPNGGSRGDTKLSRSIEGGKMKAQGVKPGVPDVHLPIARGGYFSLYVELKVGDNTTSSAQDKRIKRLRDEGHAVAVCWGWESARDCLVAYLALRPTRGGET